LTDLEVRPFAELVALDGLRPTRRSRATGPRR
jgi:hypothetical protein